MLETVCMKIRLKPGSLPRVREWAAELMRRAPETLATMQDEGVVVESAFLDTTPDGDFLIYYMKAASLAHASDVVRRSPHPIDAYHQAFKAATWESRTPLAVLVDLDRIPG